jgi:hypothetical protein
MRRVTVFALAAVLAARTGVAQTEVHKVGDKLDLRATASPISEILDRIARETGMKVTYDGPAPRGRVSVTRTGVTPAQAVLAVLEGQGLNYALRMDPQGVRIETLLLVAGSGASASASAPTRPQPGPRAIDREPDVTEPEEEAPSEAPVTPPEEQRRPFPFPGVPPPSGPAVPLSLPTPAPAPAPSPTSPQTQT